MSFILSGPPILKKRQTEPSAEELELHVSVPCDLCHHRWQMWSWDFEELMLCCPQCKVGEPIYNPFGYWTFIESFEKVTNWICVSVQSIEE